MKTILIVNDTSAISTLLVATLEQAGYAVIEAGDRSGVMQCIEETRPDAIILDLMVPEIDGWDTLRALKSAEDTRDIPVIISSASRGDDDLVKARQMGAHDYVIKPWPAATMLERLRWVLSEAV